MSCYSMQDAIKVRRDMKHSESKKSLPRIINKGKKTRKGKKK